MIYLVLCNTFHTQFLNGRASQITSARCGLPLSGTVPYKEQFPEYICAVSSVGRAWKIPP